MKRFARNGCLMTAGWSWLSFPSSQISIPRPGVWLACWPLHPLSGKRAEDGIQEDFDLEERSSESMAVSWITV